MPQTKPGGVIVLGAAHWDIKDVRFDRMERMGVVLLSHPKWGSFERPKPKEV